MANIKIPPTKLKQLNQGVIETASLNEWLKVDQKKLLNSLANELGFIELEELSTLLPDVSVPKQIIWVGSQITEEKILKDLKAHTSDVARCWSCYALAKKKRTLKSALTAVKPFAKDSHFGVREVAWMAVRDEICEQPKESIELLNSWAKDKDANVRRFASEATRPRGVWAKHIKEFKEDPTPATPLLNELYTDAVRYVQDSVGNWLNDAAKDHPGWVTTLVTKWRKKSNSKETSYIIKRATRSIK